MPVPRIFSRRVFPRRHVYREEDSGFKVNFKNVFVGPRRKSLPTARFCNPRTLIRWQDGLKSVDPAVPPRDPLYFLRLSGKNPRNDAGRIHHRSSNLFVASPRFRCFRCSRNGTLLVSKRNYFSQMYRVRHAFDRKKKIIDRSFRLSSTLLRSRGFHAGYIYIYTVATYQKHRSVETTLGISRSIPFGGGRCVKSAVSFARVVLRGAARMSGVGGRDPGAEVARKQERAGRAGGYCLLGDLSSNTSRQATRPGHQAWGQTRAFYPYPWGQPPAPVEIKNSLYYTSHSVLPWPPSSPPPSPGQTVYTILSFPPPALLSFRRALSLSLVTSCLPSLQQRLVQRRGPT